MQDRREIKLVIYLKDDSAKQLSDLWEQIDENQKKKLLKSRGLNLSWSKTKTINEMVNRGGGMIAKDLHSLVKEWKKSLGFII